MNKAVVEKLEQFRQSNTWQSQRKADAFISDLKPLITSAEHSELLVAHAKYHRGEGANILYHVIGELISKYRQDDEDKNFEKTFA